MKHMENLKKIEHEVISTTCISYFYIQSSGRIEDIVGFVPDENSFFKPSDITKLMGEEPFELAEMGQKRTHGNGIYSFSSWSGYKKSTPVLDAEKQCMKIVRDLEPYREKLQLIKSMYSVDFTIVVETNIYNEQCPYFAFNKEIIEFCHNTETQIIIKPTVFDKEY